jgi:hypothetical protein
MADALQLCLHAGDRGDRGTNRRCQAAPGVGALADRVDDLLCIEAPAIGPATELTYLNIRSDDVVIL